MPASIQGLIPAVGIGLVLYGLGYAPLVAIGWAFIAFAPCVVFIESAR